MEAVCQLEANKMLEDFICVGKSRSRCSEVFLRKGVLKICSKFIGEYPCRSVISIKLKSPANLLHIFRTPFPKNTSGRLRLKKETFCTCGHL